MVMTTDEMRSAAAEIRTLRRVIELQEARIRGFDDALALVFARPPERGGIGRTDRDHAAMLENHADAVDREVSRQTDKHEIF